MKNLLSVQILVLFNSVVYISSWQYFTSLSDLDLQGSPKTPEHTHSEYRYGDCKSETKIFYAHVHLDHMDVLGKVIIRAWLNILRIPTCIILRGTAYEEDTFRSTTYPFQMCVPRITYCHTQKRFKYYYYEWYIPNEKYIGGMNWDILFYGPPNLTW